MGSQWKDIRLTQPALGQLIILAVRSEKFNFIVANRVSSSIYKEVIPYWDTIIKCPMKIDINKEKGDIYWLSIPDLKLDNVYET